jgi:hypothetical protein
MRRSSVIAFFLLAPLAACSNGSPPPAPAASSQQPAPAAAAATPAAAPASDDSLTPLFGTWALDPAQCESQTLKISKTRFEGPGNGCDVSGYADNGDGTYTADVSCAGTAEKIRMRPIFAPTGEGIDLTYLDRKNLASTVLRCPAPATK